MEIEYITLLARAIIIYGLIAWLIFIYRFNKNNKK